MFVGTTPNISISASKAHMCMFCEQQFQKLSRHQRRHHKEEPSVAAAVKLKDGSEAQILAFEKIRLLGDYHHNCNVLAVGEGELIVVRKPSKPASQAKFLPCPHCLGFFKGDELWWHCLVCQHKAATDEKKWTAVKFFVKNEVERRKRRVKKQSARSIGKQTIVRKFHSFEIR